MTLETIKAKLKKENPTLKRGSDNTGYEEIIGEEYEAIIDQWAAAAYAEELKAQQAEAQAQAKTALLNRLGITAEEANLLLS